MECSPLPLASVMACARGPAGSCALALPSIRSNKTTPRLSSITASREHPRAGLGVDHRMGLADRVAVIAQVENPVAPRRLVPGNFAEQPLQNETALMGERATREKPENTPARRAALLRLQRRRFSPSAPPGRRNFQGLMAFPLSESPPRRGPHLPESRPNPGFAAPRKQTTCGLPKVSSASSIPGQHLRVRWLGYQNRNFRFRITRQEIERV